MQILMSVTCRFASETCIIFFFFFFQNIGAVAADLFSQRIPDIMTDADTIDTQDKAGDEQGNYLSILAEQGSYPCMYTEKVLLHIYAELGHSLSMHICNCTSECVCGINFRNVSMLFRIACWL